METAAGCERRSPPGLAVPPSPRGHAPLAAASGPLSSPACEPPQPEEGQQLRISQSGQFSDGLEDRGERTQPGLFTPARPLALAQPLPLARRARRGARLSLLPGLGRARSRDLPAKARRADRQPHLSRSAPPRNPRTGCLLGKLSGARTLLLTSASLSPCPSSVHWKSLWEAVFASPAERSRGTAAPAQLGGTWARCVLLPEPSPTSTGSRDNFPLWV